MTGIVATLLAALLIQQPAPVVEMTLLPPSRPFTRR